MEEAQRLSPSLYLYTTNVLSLSRNVDVDFIYFRDRWCGIKLFPPSAQWQHGWWWQLKCRCYRVAASWITTTPQFQRSSWDTQAQRHPRIFFPNQRCIQARWVNITPSTRIWGGWWKKMELNPHIPSTWCRIRPDTKYKICMDSEDGLVDNSKGGSGF